MINQSILCGVLSLFFGGSNLLAGVVTQINDSGPGSLRATIAAASSGETITFDSQLSGQTIVLTSGQIVLSNNLIISALSLSNKIILSGNANSRLFEVMTGASNQLHGLILTNGSVTGDEWGDTGGAVLNWGHLVLSNCTLIGNSAATIGGAFMNAGSARIESSSITYNSSGFRSGGIFNSGGGAELVILNSTISDNSASESAGGISDGGSSSSLLLVNSTVARNSSAVRGGGLYIFGLARVINTTISDNIAHEGGGVCSGEGSLVLENSIVAGNEAAEEPNLGGDYRRLDIYNSLTSGSPKLAPLGFYGSATKTMPPLPGSAAIEGALMTTNSPATDQRGAPRPSGPLPDIGAVEAVAFSTLGLLDADMDGIPDLLEGTNSPYFHLTVGVNDSAADTDNDDSRDAEEIANMTDLFDPNDNFRVLMLSPNIGFNATTNPVFDVTLRTFPGLAYSLVTGGSITNFQELIGSHTTASNFVETFRVSLPVGGSQGFIRAKRE